MGNGSFNSPEIGSAVTIRPVNIFVVEIEESVVWVIVQVPIAVQKIQEM